MCIKLYYLQIVLLPSNGTKCELLKWRSRMLIVGWKDMRPYLDGQGISSRR